MELVNILNITDESERKRRLQEYGIEKSSCETDPAGTKCSSCRRNGTKECFNPTKAKREGWKWGNN